MFIIPIIIITTTIIRSSCLVGSSMRNMSIADPAVIEKVMKVKYELVQRE